MVDVGSIVPAFMKVVAQNYLNFEGRTNRFVYWHFILGYVVLSIIVGIVVGILAGIIGGTAALLSNLFSLALLLPSLGAMWRRMHDIGKVGWWGLIPFYNLYLAAQPGEAGENRFGAAPAPNMG